MDFALSDIAFSDVGVHVLSSLAAFIVIDFYKSVFLRDRSRRREQKNAIAQVRKATDQSPTGKQAEPGEVQRSWLSLLIGWLFMFVFKVAVKATLALLAAGFAVSWLDNQVNLAVAYRLSADTADTLLGMAFFLVMVLVWWILPIRLFRR